MTQQLMLRIINLTGIYNYMYIRVPLKYMNFYILLFFLQVVPFTMYCNCVHVEASKLQ